MRPTIDFRECLKDSPKFRTSLEGSEGDLEILEARLERMVKLCTLMIETGKSFKRASSDFVIGVRDLASYFKDDDLIVDDTKVCNCLNKFAHEMSEMLKYFTILLDQANRSVCKNLANFIKNDIKKVKDSKKDFEKISDELDSALVRNAGVQRSKPLECEEAANQLKAKRSGFSLASLDYVFQINILHSKKRFDILETLLSFMHAQSTFFHQGHELFKEFEPEMKCVATQVEELSAKASLERKDMEQRHSLVQQKNIKLSQNNSNTSNETSIQHMEGYLFKKTSKGFKSWVRRWFMIQNNQFVYRKRSGVKECSVMEEDLRLCTVKPAHETERRFCFDVLSPSRSHMLQAETEDDCQMWITEIQTGITNAFRSASNVQNQVEEENEMNRTLQTSTDEDKVASPPPVQQSKAQQRMEQLLSIPGNDHCCDCGSPEPRWTSINLGITLCIECSGIHRSFGVHLSKVRSITLDAWEQEQMKVMVELGNDIVNRIYEASVDESIATKATFDCKRSVRENWVRSKYVDKAFVMKLPGPKVASRARGWSVKRKTKRPSPSRSLNKDESHSDLESDVTSGLMEARKINSKPPVLSVSNTSKDCDSGLGASATDVIVFGDSEIEVPDLTTSLDLESSEDSEVEDDGEDTKSTTSWEDMSKLDPNMLLYKAAQARNLAVMLEALANGADPNWVHEEEEGKTPLMKVVETGSLSACEFLLLNGAKLTREDKNGRTPLHHATMNGNTGQVCQFLKRGADLHSKDKKGQDPLDIAVSTANADIVTLLRLAKLNEEMKESGGGFNNPGDDTFQDVFRDFSNMASNNPEKLKRSNTTGSSSNQT
ncbi:arf-GAP with coiled-coil, ANK repeat and PH domain-containing protein 2-like isoform X2 [Mizuhopecten yessoensis]|uniref:Arf-GAP with coiled-coil, ANK repeat and PH domain-containing protein 2 n=1 Tax=Mizuhopecten yessoensis TaxID=6573 RepID=A0A210QD91_MIZYE|nr:arf-GAP with coiled-coil, ANK repeat and PH domain-containing protein 2-like isoform X2 [Mizuhopecten yessoensis]OWF46700.1 Arf-GAP with coiled-coil, ANK repeat and PH domain-containing protein 2 [Mizuhopecten yessoensis]